MDEILVEFKEESSELVEKLIDILDQAEDDYSQRSQLEEYGQIVDRIMGGAKSMEMALDTGVEGLDKIGKYADLCKAVGYKASQVDDNEQFYNVVVALLQDATEMLEEMIDALGTSKQKDVKDLLSNTFLDRLHWISGQFKEGLRASVATNAEKAAEAGQSNDQNDIDALLAQLGLNTP